MTFLAARAWSADYYPDPFAFHAIVTQAIEHRAWFDDSLWEAPEAMKRAAVIEHLQRAYTTGRIWSVLREGEIVGILLLESVRPGVDALCHFLFFDRMLANKRHLLKAAMADAFQRFGLAVLRVEVPTFAAKLCGFLRKALGFRYEGEWLDGAPDEAKRLSRRFRTIRYEGRWHDSLLLSITAEAFHALAKESDERPQDDAARHEPDSPAPAAGGGPPDEPARRPDDADAGLSGELPGFPPAEP